jgi:cytochrome oxidase Cu insertion factor (SCO1/SenC/PrrC family)
MRRGIVALAVAALALGCDGAGDKAGPAAGGAAGGGQATSGQGQAAPAFTLRDVEGKEVSLASFRGKGVLLNFWAVG